MRTKFEHQRTPSDEERTFIDVMEKYEEATIVGLCQVVFGKDYDANLERTLRRYRERYQNFKYAEVIPQGVIVKAQSERGRDVYRLVRSTDPYARVLRLRAELDLVCAAIQRANTRRILGELQAVGQLDNLDDLLQWREELEAALDE